MESRRAMITVPIDAALVHGADHLERTDRGVRPHRLPGWALAQAPDPRLAAMAAQPAGVRLAFRTRATRIELDLHPSRQGVVGLQRPRGAVDLVLDGDLAPGGEVTTTDVLTGGDRVDADPATGSMLEEQGPSHTSRFAGLPARDKRVELWLPHNESVELLALRADAPLEPVAAVGRRWFHHGSSISQGSNAASPARTWAALAARRAGLELTNLGFGGNALMDPALARILRDSPADVISLELGINIVNSDAMRLRTFVPAVHGYLDTIRDGHPRTPLIIVSPLHCAIHETTAGPGAFDPDAFADGEIRFIATGGEPAPGDGRLTLTLIREVLARLVEQREDPHLHLIDGTALHGAQDEIDHPLPDALHPDTDTHRVIAERFVRSIGSVIGPGRAPC